MRHKLITTLLATSFGMAFAGPTAHAQQPQVIPAPEIGGNAPLMDAYLWHVRGLPPGQRLAVYSGAGPKFRIIDALDEGTPIERLSCKDSRGGYWCRIATVDHPRISGWVDGRFLLEETGFAPPQEERNAPLEPEILIDPFEKPRRR
ncbi:MULTISPECIES: SH3 domain-containing protein [unclassified Rhizobium]|uniref:SH3 domain-containing protein n=1 Tax=unclassified Rhizobium TaxID=2613769 RepID=UPI000A8BA3C4|nr:MULTISPECIES: SH3 domain-containing protein [unclassified Rhizobium]